MFSGIKDHLCAPQDCLRGKLVGHGTGHAALPEGGAIAGEIRELRQVCEHGPPDGHAGVAP